MLLLDRTGELRELCLRSATGFQRTSRDSVVSSYNNVLNFLLTGLCLLARGERARALDTLSMVHRYILWLVRIHEGKILLSDTRAFRNLERDISPSAYNRFVECTGSLQGDGLERAYEATWLWSKQLIYELMERYEINVPLKLIELIDSRLADSLSH
jgi:lincosamide nucleotidyltransferase B/F